MADATEGNPERITITVRIIKSFEYRTFKNLILHGCVEATKLAEYRDAVFSLDETTVGKLKDICREKIKTASGFKPFLNVNLDTMKLYFFAHGQKTSNLIINIDKEDVFMDDATLLKDLGVANETEISFFNRETYEAYKSHPDTKW